nr:MAG TPA: Papain fold toxin 1, glutamine deamidase [Caudoviricetes sp.]
MAKRLKTNIFSFQGFDNAHYKTTAAYTRAVNALFDKATSDIAEAANKEDYNPDKPFSFDDYPRAKARLQTTLKGLAKKMQAVIETGSRKQWLFACKKNEEFISSIFDTTKLTKGRLKKMQDRNLDALQAFQQRKVGGMDLSERVWKYTEQYKEQIEIGLDVGLGEGRSAQQLSRDLRQNLKDPDRLFRRVRDKRGNLQLSKAAKAFHPGRGVYRSSYKNAMRLTRSEINMAYREADHLRWQQLDFVVGFEIHRSNHEPQFKCKLCDRLVGKYPKTFKFKGWHPQCMCYATAILMDEEDFDNQELSDLKSALKGTEYKKYSAKNAVTDFPEEFKKWVEENAPRQRSWKSTPYFIKDNFVDGDLTKGLRYIPKVEPTATSVDFAFDYDTPNESLDAYISGEAMWLNNYLRGRGDFGVLSKGEQSLLDELTTITQKEKVGERVLWRSVDARAIFGDMSDSEYEDLLGRLVYGDDRRAIIEMTQRFLDVSGTKQEEKGFMSTTKDKNIAMQWGAYTGSRTPVLLKIKTTAETRGIDVERYTLIHNPEAEREQPQKEVLLRRGLQYKVVAIKELEGHICVEVELLDNANGNSKQASTVDPIQQELDALQPQIVSIRQKSAEWGLNTPLLDAALAARNPKDVVLAILSLKNRVNNAMNGLKVFIADMEATIKDAKVNKVDSSDVFADLQAIKADKRYWLMGKDAMKQRLEGLKSRIVQALSNVKGERTEIQRANEKEIAELLKVKQGLDMSFDEANELRGNPNYQQEYIPDPNGIYRDKQGNKFSKNPSYKKKFTVNCQSCVVANELRRRGLDVEAQGNTQRKGNIPTMLSHHTELAWVDENGQTPTSQRTYGADVLATLTNLDTLTKEQGRYHIRWQWNSGRSGHIITCERLVDGTMRYYDPQNGKVITDFSTYASRFNLSSGIKVLRVDTLQINKDLIAGIVSKRKKNKG